jgi:hypothetical protein
VKKGASDGVRVTVGIIFDACETFVAVRDLDSDSLDLDRVSPFAERVSTQSNLLQRRLRLVGQGTSRIFFAGFPQCLFKLYNRRLKTEGRTTPVRHTRRRAA